ncbi:MAG: BspA family leucine-rich repeat surface protein [Erysipelotrichaceae bacterium]|nr:BspA family leucine-rich repeat surface protein [Erysipelotrichaceae bacterium]
MFQFCELLTSLDLSNFDTSNVTDMNCMFAGCVSLTDLDVTIDKSSVEDDEDMFYNCPAGNNY